MNFHKSYIVVILLLLFAISLKGSDYQLKLNFNKEEFNVKVKNSYHEIINDNNEDYFVDQGESGSPQLPLYNQSILIPAHKSVSKIEIVSISEKELNGKYNIYPIQRLYAIGETWQFTYPNPSVYNRDIIYPEKPFQLLSTGNYNGYRIASFAVFPFRYNPVKKKLYFISQIEIEITYKDNTREVVKPGRLYSRDFKKMKSTVQNLVVNPIDVELYNTDIQKSEENLNQSIESTPSENGLAVQYVIITTNALSSSYSNLANWKTKKGVPTEVKTLEWIKSNTPNGIDDAETIRNFIKWAYQKWGTKYILLGGDTDIIPSRNIHSYYYDFPSDYYFADLDGTWNYNQNNIFGEVADSVDAYAEVYVARLPVTTTSEVTNIVNKIIKYEKLNSVTNSNYPNNFLFMAANLLWEGDAQWLIDDFIAPNVGSTVSKTYINETTNIGSNPQIAIDSLNGNYGFVFSEHHGAYNLIRPGAKGSEMFSFNVDNLTNSDMSIWYSVTCNANDINKNCFGEHYVNNSNNGGVGYIGNSDGDWPFFSRLFHGEFFDQIFSENKFHLSEAHYESHVPYQQHCKVNNSRRITNLSAIVLGDPEMPIWTAAPFELDVTEPELVIGENDVQVSVDIVDFVGEPVLSDFLVVLYREGEVYEMAYTNSQGVASFEFHIQTSNDIYLTVTKHNFIPYESTIQITGGDGPHLHQTDYSIEDNGNDNGFAEAGETIQLYLTVENNGKEDAEEVEIELSCNNSFVSVTTSTLRIESIPEGEDVELEEAFVFTLDEDMPIDTTISLHIDYTYGKDEPIGEEDLFLSAGGPDVLVIENTLVTFEAKLKSNSLKNENIKGDDTYNSELDIVIFNIGKAQARGVTGTITCSDLGVEITNNTVNFSNVNAGSSTQSTSCFEFEHTIPVTSITLNLTLTDYYGKSWQSTLNLSDPSQPSGLSFEPYDETSILLTWDISSSNDLLGYFLERRISGQGSYQRINNSPITNGGYYHDTSLSTNTSYDYKIIAVDSSGNLTNASSTITGWPSLPSLQNFPLFTDEEAVGSEGNGLVTYDFDSDGTMEIVVTGANGFIKIYNHDGTVYRSFTGLEGDMNIPAIGNVYGSSQKEIVVSSRKEGFQENHIYVLNPYTGGTFWDYDLVYKAPQSVVLKDLDSNGKDDIIVLSHSGNDPDPVRNDSSHLHIFKSTGTTWTQFTSWPSGGYAFLSGYCLGVPAAGAVHPNGYMDVIVGGHDSTLYCFRPATSNQPVWTKTLTGMLNSPITIGDLDGDDRKEIVLNALKSNKLYVIGYDGTLVLSKNVNVTDPYGFTSPPIIGNMDTDAYLEIAVMGRDSIYIFEHNGNVKTNWPVPIDNGDSFFDPVRYKMGSIASPVLADINCDDTTDIIINTSYGMIYAFNCQTANAVKGFPINIHFDQGQPLLIDDIDNDNDLEVLVIGNDATLRIFNDPNQYTGSPTIEWSQSYGNFMHTGEYDLSISKTSFQLSNLNNSNLTVPREFKFEQNYPNPFNPLTTLRYQLPKTCHVKLEIFSITGEKIQTLVNENQVANYYSIQWNGLNEVGSKVSSGVYLYRIEAGDPSAGSGHRFIKTNKMLLLK